MRTFVIFFNISISPSDGLFFFFLKKRCAGAALPVGVGARTAFAEFAGACSGLVYF